MEGEVFQYLGDDTSGKALDDEIEHTSPGRHGSNTLPLGTDSNPVDLAAASVNIDLMRAEPSGAFPDEAADPEEENDGEGEVGLEEAFGIVEFAFVTRRGDGDVELPGQWLAPFTSSLLFSRGNLPAQSAPGQSGSDPARSRKHHRRRGKGSHRWCGRGTSRHYGSGCVQDRWSPR